MSSANNNNQQHRNLIGHRIADGRLEFVSVLGLGAYGVVYLARDLTHYLHQQPFASSSSQQASPSLLAAKHGTASGYYAVKCLNKIGLDSRQRAFQRREIMLHTMASGHPNIVSLHRVIDDPEDPCVYVVLDYCPDGDLFSMITETQRYQLPNAPKSSSFCCPLTGEKMDAAFSPERREMDRLIRNVFDQILDAVEHCHSMCIYHRDLKPENILCLEGGAKVVLADFGLATGEKTSSDFGCGSTFYMGPECQGGITHRLQNYSTAANDVWSLGVILVNLVCGRNPWKQACPNDETFREYLRNPEFLKEILPISEGVNSILKRVFTFRADARCTIADLRAMVRQVDRLTATGSEIKARQEKARIAAAKAHAARQAEKAAAAHAQYQRQLREQALHEEAAKMSAIQVNAMPQTQNQPTVPSQLIQQGAYPHPAQLPEPVCNKVHISRVAPNLHSDFESFDEEDSDHESSSSCDEDDDCEIASPVIDQSQPAPRVTSAFADHVQLQDPHHYVSTLAQWALHAPVSAQPLSYVIDATPDGHCAVRQQPKKHEMPGTIPGLIGQPAAHLNARSQDTCHSPASTNSSDFSYDASSGRSDSGESRRSSASYTGLPPTPQFTPQTSEVHAQEPRPSRKRQIVSSGDLDVNLLALSAKLTLAKDADVPAAYLDTAGLRPSPFLDGAFRGLSPQQEKAQAAAHCSSHVRDNRFGSLPARKALRQPQYNSRHSVVHRRARNHLASPFPPQA